MDEELRDDELPEKEDSSAEETKSPISADLIRGHIDTIILCMLYEKDKYGYEIMDEIEKRSHKQYTIKQPTLYSALKRLETKGFINAYFKNEEYSGGGRRKYFTLTDSGREIAEKNKTEWKYSRTVIDNLISDEDFDFSQPAPAAVDFTILKNSTSRTNLKKSEDDDDEEREVSYEGSTAETYSFPVKEREIEEVKEQPAPAPTSPEPQPAPAVDPVPEPAPAPVPEPVPEPTPVPPFEQPVQAEPYAEPIPPVDEEAKKRQHENYLKLISDPVKKEPEETDQNPAAATVDTEDLIYNNKPETERDYRNLVNGLFANTLKQRSATPAPAPYVPEPAPYSEPTPYEPEPMPQYQPQYQPQYPAQPVQEQFETPQPQPQPQPQSQPQPQPQPDYTENTVKVHTADEFTVKGENDGLKVKTSDYSVSPTSKRRYNRGGTLFKCSLIIMVIMLLEFSLCLIFKNYFAIDYAYPFIILALSLAQAIIFGILCYTDSGKSTRKPTSLTYLSASVIIAVILILIICLISLLIGTNFTAANEVVANIVIPSVVVLNIPLFAVFFYAFSK